MRPTFDEAVYSMLHLLPIEGQKKVYSRFVNESGRAACEIGFSFCYRKDVARVDEAKVTCPVLIVAGGQDRITPASVVREIAAKYRDVSTYKEFPNHAHWVIGEPHWEEVAEYISDWLERVKRVGLKA